MASVPFLDGEDWSRVPWGQCGPRIGRPGARRRGDLRTSNPQIVGSSPVRGAGAVSLLAYKPAPRASWIHGKGGCDGALLYSHRLEQRAHVIGPPRTRAKHLGSSTVQIPFGDRPAKCGSIWFSRESGGSLGSL